VEIQTRSKARCSNSVNHCTVSQDRKVEGRTIERDELRRQRRDLLHEGRDQVLLWALSDVRCADCIYNPVTAFFAVGDQRPDANDGACRTAAGRRMNIGLTSDTALGAAQDPNS
jgi:hypothetical protein